MTQQTAATAEESAAASEELNAQAETAMAEVERVEAIIGGARKDAMQPSGFAQAADMMDDDSVLPMPQAPPMGSRQGLRAVDRQSGRNTGTFGQF